MHVKYSICYAKYLSDEKNIHWSYSKRQYVKNILRKLYFPTMSTNTKTFIHFGQDTQKSNICRYDKQTTPLPIAYVNFTIANVTLLTSVVKTGGQTQIQSELTLNIQVH